LKRFIKATSYGQILFHKKGVINEAIVELDVKSVYATAMRNIKILKGKTKKINVDTGNVNIDDYFTQPPYNW
jgi:hypothetical protein